MKEIGKGMKNVDMQLANKLTMKQYLKEYWKDNEIEMQKKAIAKRKKEEQTLKEGLYGIALIVLIIVVTSIMGVWTW